MIAPHPDPQAGFMHLYLSPHHDDVCFSLGHLARRQGGELINLFTRSDYVAAPLELPNDGRAKIEAVSRIRREEDLRYSLACGLSRHDLGLEEPSFHGIRPFDLRGIEDEVIVLGERLLPFLQERLASAVSEAALYCPIGIGGHRDHVATMMTIRRHFDLIHEGCTVFLYEDLPYASHPAVRETGIQRAARIFEGMPLNRLVIRLPRAGIRRKMEDVGLYPSQHDRPPKPSRYTPASEVAPAVHEVLWRVEGA
jgi:hypothetical protein